MVCQKVNTKFRCSSVIDHLQCYNKLFNLSQNLTSNNSLPIQE